MAWPVTHETASVETSPWACRCRAAWRGQGAPGLCRVMAQPLKPELPPSKSLRSIILSHRRDGAEELGAPSCHCNTVGSRGKKDKEILCLVSYLSRGEIKIWLHGDLVIHRWRDPCECWLLWEICKGQWFFSRRNLAPGAGVCVCMW